jgi:hypothetical protein
MRGVAPKMTLFIPRSIPVNHQYTYEATLAAAERIGWRVEDIIGGDKRLDFTKKFMPESLARVEQLTFLSADERRTLNQIRGNTYLRIFGIVEEFILPFILDHARPHLRSNDFRVRALLQFAGEEAKHIHLFKRFRESFDQGFGTDCQVIGPAEAIGAEVLRHDPLAVALVILQIEWMTQRHYVDSVKDDGSLDPLFKSLLRHHWMEEAQHAKLDTLIVDALAEGRTEEEIDRTIDEFLEIGAFLDSGLAAQAEFNLDALEMVIGCRLQNRKAIIAQQHQAARWTYLGSGMVHARFVATLKALSPNAARRIAEAAPMFA